MSAPPPPRRSVKWPTSFLHKPKSDSSLARLEETVAEAPNVLPKDTTGRSYLSSADGLDGKEGILFMFRRLKSCHNVEDMRLLAKQRLRSDFSLHRRGQPTTK